MSNKNKNKKYQTKKRMNPETKDKIVTGFLTLINNDACVKASREWKGALNIIPVTLAIASVVLAVLPSFITQMNVQGASGIYTAPVANFDVGLASFTHALKYDENGQERANLVHVEFTPEGTLKTTNIEELYTELPEGTVKWFVDVDTAYDEPAFEVFFNTGFSTEVDDNTFFTRINSGRDPETGLTRYYDISGAEITKPLASFIAFGKNSLAFRKVTATRGQAGTYEKIAGIDLIDLTPKASDGKDLAYNSYSYRNAIVTNWTKFINSSYEPLKVASAWQFTGVVAAIDLGMIILFGAILFLMTRGKKNPFRIINFWETMKMACYGSFTPALLSLILGFWLVNWSYLIFMFTFGLRMMWMSMKSLRPLPKE